VRRLFAGEKKTANRFESSKRSEQFPDAVICRAIATGEFLNPKQNSRAGKYDGDIKVPKKQQQGVEYVYNI
jgi:hypothetical protein